MGVLIVRLDQNPSECTDETKENNMKKLLSIPLGFALGLFAASLQASDITYGDPSSWRAPEEEYSSIASQCEKDRNPEACFKLALLRAHGPKAQII